MTKGYAGILKSSAAIGGAQGLNLLIGMIRTKGVALLLGPAGVGEVGLLTSSISFVLVICGLGIGTSAVREVAECHGAGNARQLAETTLVLRRVSWLTGLFGWVITAVLAVYLSQATFGSTDRTLTIALLGATILMGNVAAGQAAVIQGTRRIRDLAKQSVVGAIIGAVVSLGIYALMGQKGILPVLLTITLCNLVTAWWFAKRIPLERVSLTWRETFGKARRLVSVGIAFMGAGVAGTACAWAIQVIIYRQFGTIGNGVYAAATSLSAQFAGFVLGAMGADYYPRLAGAAGDHATINGMINEQTEVGILLALPGMLATLAFAPWVVQLFYSTEFAQAAVLLPWLVLGVFGRVVSWPLGFVIIALGRGRLFATTETLFNSLQVMMVFAFTHFSGSLEGAAIALPLLYATVTPVVFGVAAVLTGFRWSRNVCHLLLASGAPVFAAFLAVRLLPQLYATIVAASLTVCCAIYCIRGLALRLGPQHRLSRLASRIPWLLGVDSHVS